MSGQQLNISDEFLVAAYRRPDFRVDTTLSAPISLAGTQLDGKISAHYLHGGPMAGRVVTWTYSKIEVTDVPAAIRERFPEERYTFLGWDWEKRQPARTTIATKEETLNENGELSLELDTDREAGWPFEYRLEGDVTDVTRQHIAGRATFRVDPAPWYIGLKTPSYFAQDSYEVSGAFVPKESAARFDSGWISVPGLAATVAALGTHPEWRYERSAEAAAGSSR